MHKSDFKMQIAKLRYGPEAMILYPLIFTFAFCTLLFAFISFRAFVE